jgi:hypothetical protein
MALLRRISRALETLSRPKLDGRSLFGAQGEEYASQVLEGPGIVSRVTNPIIPTTNGRSYPLEADFLVYTQGNLFCVEVKRYKGRITYLPKPRIDGALRDNRQSGWEDYDLLQEKIGKYGERLAPRTYSNPLKKTKTFIWHLKDYLGQHVDPRFRKVFVIPVVAFVEEADISAIHSLDEGMIWVQELPTFFEQQRHPKYARSPSRWIAEGIQQVPTSDLVVTTDHHPFKGFIRGETFVFQTRSEGVQRLPYAHIRSIWLRHTWLFSDYDPMTIFLTDGSFREYECTGGSVQMIGFDSERHTHQLRNVEKIVIGRANKLLRRM